MLRFGILSTANIGFQFVIPAIQVANNAVVSAIASRDLKKARKMATHFNVPLSYGSYEQMLESDEIDCVYIPLPTSQHVDWTIKAAQAGKHVLCEKPISLKSSDIKRIIKARDKYGVQVSEAFMVTYHPQWLKVRDLIAKGVIGELRRVDASFSYFNKDPINMRNRPELGGGAIPDIGVYPVVTTRFATGLEPKRLQAIIDYDPDFKTDRYASVTAEFPGFELSFYLSTQLAKKQSMVFHGDKGYIEMSAPYNSNVYEGDVLRVHDANHTETKEIRYTGVNQYQCEVEAFARAVAGKRQHIFSLEESLLNQRMIDTIYKAGKSGKWEKV